MYVFARKFLNIDSLLHNKFLNIGIFWGTWNNGDFIFGSRTNGVFLDSEALKKTQYKLHGTTFFGLPKETMYQSILATRHNPKRKKEVAFFQKRGIKPFENKFVHSYIAGINVDFIFDTVQSIITTIGLIRVKLGMSFDPWR